MGIQLLQMPKVETCSQTHYLHRAQSSSDFRTFGLSTNNMLKKIFILPIRLYQVSISPLLGTHCRHVPSCSQYAVEAIQEWGVLKGIWLGTKRIARCHPWGTHGYDPVPKRGKP